MVHRSGDVATRAGSTVPGLTARFAGRVGDIVFGHTGMVVLSMHSVGAESGPATRVVCGTAWGGGGSFSSLHRR